MSEELVSQEVGVRLPSRVNVSEMAKMIERGMTYTEIGAHFGVSRDRIRQLAGKAGLNGARSWAACETRRKALVDMVRNGAEPEAAAVACGFSVTSAFTVLRRADIGRRDMVRERFNQENVAAIEAIRKGASIRSQSRNRAHEAKLGLYCRKHNIIPKYAGGRRKGAAARKIRLMAALDAEARQ